MRTFILATALLASLSGCAADGYGPRRETWRDYHRWDHDRVDPRYGRYDADRYYRDGRYYQQRRLGLDDRIYRGRNDRYYCRRDDGTTGLIIGGVTGAVLGRYIARGDSRTLGAIIGAAIGAAVGHEIDRDNVTCR